MSNPLRKTLESSGLPKSVGRTGGQPRSVSPTPAAPAQRATVTPLRRGSKQGVSDVNEILTVHPEKYGDAKIIAEAFREGIPVIINLTQMSESEARRLVDFSSGLSQGLHGHIERVTPKSLPAFALPRHGEWRWGRRCVRARRSSYGLGQAFLSPLGDTVKAMSLIATVVYLALGLFLLALWVRFIFDWVQVLSRGFRPQRACSAGRRNGLFRNGPPASGGKKSDPHNPIWWRRD